MADEPLPAPPGWAEADTQPDRPDVTQAKRPIVFEHESADVAVHVVPDEPEGAAHWRVGIARGGYEHLYEVEPVERGIDDRAAAIDRAESLMAAFNREGEPAHPEDVDWTAAMRDADVAEETDADPQDESGDPGP